MLFIPHKKSGRLQYSTTASGRKIRLYQMSESRQRASTHPPTLAIVRTMHEKPPRDVCTMRTYSERPRRHRVRDRVRDRVREPSPLLTTTATASRDPSRVPISRHQSRALTWRANSTDEWLSSRVLENASRPFVGRARGGDVVVTSPVSTGVWDATTTTTTTAATPTGDGRRTNGGR